MNQDVQGGIAHQAACGACQGTPDPLFFPLVVKVASQLSELCQLIFLTGLNDQDALDKHEDAQYDAPYCEAVTHL